MGQDVANARELTSEAVEAHHLAQVIGQGPPLDEPDVPEDGDAERLDGLPERHVRRRAEVRPLGVAREALVVEVERGQPEIPDAATQVLDLALVADLAL